MRVETVDHWETFQQCRPEWNRLVAQSRQNVPFLRFEWLDAWWRHFGQTGDELRILLLRSEDGALLAGAPLLRRRQRVWGSTCRVLQFLANDHSSRCGFVVHRSCDVDDAVTALWTHMGNTLRWDLVYLRDLADDPEDGVLDALQRHLRKTRRLHSINGELRSPYLEVTGEWAAFEKQIPGSFRRNLRSKARKLEREVGPVKYERVVDEEPGLERRLAVGLTLERAGWKGRAGCAIAQDSAVESFYKSLAEAAVAQGWLHLGFLAAGGKPLAFVFGLEYAERLYLLKIGYGEQFGGYSPGQLMRLREVADVHARGLKGYELLGAETKWKRRFTNRVRVHRALVVYRGSLRAAPPYLMEAWVMPRLRRSATLQRLKARWRARRGEAGGSLGNGRRGDTRCV